MIDCTKTHEFEVELTVSQSLINPNPNLHFFRYVRQALLLHLFPSMQQAPIEKRKQLTAIRKEVGDTDDESGSSGVTGKR